MKDLLCKVFPHYTEAMYEGNEPAGKGHEHIAGGYCDRWDCRWGEGETYNGKIIHADFKINHNVNIFICRNSLLVVDHRYSGKCDFWEYCVNHPGMPGAPCCSEKSRHKLEPERLEQYLNTVIPDCKFWDMVQARARELVKVGDV